MKLTTVNSFFLDYFQKSLTLIKCAIISSHFSLIMLY